MVSFSIAGREVGEAFPPLVIAEIGINHEGSLETAFAMVDAAHFAGAELIKHQTHIVDDEMSPAAKKLIPGNADISIYEIMRRCALSEAEEFELKRYVESKGMIFISTPFSRAAAQRLEKMEVPAFKIGSGECNNYPLIKHIADYGKPMIVSTGMNDISSVRETVRIMTERAVPFALMHTTNLYPTPVEYVRLGAMQELQREFPNCVIGLSDHTTSNLACLAATALGAALLERHFTDRKNRDGPDIQVSMDGKDLRALIEDSGDVWRMRGGQKKPLEQEQCTIDFAFATVVAIKAIAEGDVFSEDNIWVKRPGTGEIGAKHYESLLGRISRRSIEVDKHIEWSDLA